MKINAYAPTRMTVELRPLLDAICDLASRLHAQQIIQSSALDHGRHGNV
jgi:hypothetical protein